MAAEPNPFFQKTIIYAEDAASPGTYHAIRGQFDSNGYFVLMTNGSGGSTPVTPYSYLMENGTSYYLLEDGTSKYILG